MKIIKCDYSHGFDAHCEEAVAAAAEDLAAGRLIVYPTETVYGIGADIYNESAVKNLYVAKNRPFDMPLSVAVSDKAMLESIAVLNENADKLVKRIQSGEVSYDFVEVMACRRGCIMGGGQPVGAGPRTRKARAKGLYDTDVNMQIKKSNENPMVLALYEGLLKGKTHQLLHRNLGSTEN